MPDPGWYDDPDDARLERWFDGTHWTQHVVEKAARPGRAAPLSSRSEPPAAPARSSIRRISPRRLLVPLALVALVVAGGAAFATRSQVPGGGGRGDPANGVGSVDTGISAVAGAETPQAVTASGDCPKARPMSEALGIPMSLVDGSTTEACVYGSEQVRRIGQIDVPLVQVLVIRAAELSIESSAADEARLRESSDTARIQPVTGRSGSGFRAIGTYTRDHAGPGLGFFADPFLDIKVLLRARDGSGLQVEGATLMDVGDRLNRLVDAIAGL